MVMQVLRASSKAARVGRHHMRPTQAAGVAVVTPCLRQAAPAWPARHQSCSRQANSARQCNPWAARCLATNAQPDTKKWEVRMLYDGDCPLCMREVNMLQRRDAGKGKIDFVNIGAADYDPAQNAGITYEQAMGNIHAITRQGDVITNVEVFKRLYEQVGLGWVYGFATIKPLRAVADRVYNFWARYRLPLTRRPDMATILAEKRTCKGSS